MHISASRLTCGLAALALTAASAPVAGTSATSITGASDAPGAAQPAKAAGFELTVDSVMRGPKLVGYPPTGSRWSGDSARLHFEWRRPSK